MKRTVEPVRPPAKQTVAAKKAKLPEPPVNRNEPAADTSEPPQPPANNIKPGSHPAPLIKVCGMREAENIALVVECGPDMMGFIFWPGSPRCCAGLTPDALNSLGPKTARVGVFVNETPERIAETARKYGLTHIQLHGEESPEFCARLGEYLGEQFGARPGERIDTRSGERFGNQIGTRPKIIKAFGIASARDLEKTDAYEGLCDLFIFDAKVPGRGGSGMKFDHRVLEAYSGRTPYLLSGGIGPDDTGLLHEIDDPRCIGVDINSRFETAPGVKDVRAVGEFIGTVKS